MLSVTLICCIASSFKDFKCRHQHFKIVIIKKKTNAHPWKVRMSRECQKTGSASRKKPTTVKAFELLPQRHCFRSD